MMILPIVMMVLLTMIVILVMMRTLRLMLPVAATYGYVDVDAGTDAGNCGTGYYHDHGDDGYGGDYVDSYDDNAKHVHGAADDAGCYDTYGYAGIDADDAGDDDENHDDGYL